jgi:CRISPR-associated protein Cas2
MLIVVCYDIADDRRRSRAARLFEGYGERVQESVFECHLDAVRVRRLKTAIEKEIDPREDRLRFYRLCGKDSLLIVRHGTGGPPQDGQDVLI